MPSLNALAFSVCDVVMVTPSPEAIEGSDSAGSFPFLVYRIVAPAVVIETLTVFVLV